MVELCSLTKSFLTKRRNVCKECIDWINKYLHQANKQRFRFSHSFFSANLCTSVLYWMRFKDTARWAHFTRHNVQVLYFLNKKWWTETLTTLTSTNFHHCCREDVWNTATSFRCQNWTSHSLDKNWREPADAWTKSNTVSCSPVYKRIKTNFLRLAIKR